MNARGKSMKTKRKHLRWMRVMTKFLWKKRIVVSAKELLTCPLTAIEAFCYGYMLLVTDWLMFHPRLMRGKPTYHNMLNAVQGRAWLWTLGFAVASSFGLFSMTVRCHHWVRILAMSNFTFMCLYCGILTKATRSDASVIPVFFFFGAWGLFGLFLAICETPHGDAIHLLIKSKQWVKSAREKRNRLHDAIRTSVIVR